MEFHVLSRCLFIPKNLKYINEMCYASTPLGQISTSSKAITCSDGLNWWYGGIVSNSTLQYLCICGLLSDTLLGQAVDSVS